MKRPIKSTILRYSVLSFYLLCLMPFYAYSMEPFEISKSQIKYVYDGDTFYIKCIDGLRCNGGKLGIRALELDTPELRGECELEIVMARKAKQHLVALKDRASTIVINPNNKRPYDKYNRLLANVSFDNFDWNDYMIDRGLGREWTAKRGDWC